MTLHCMHRNVASSKPSADTSSSRLKHMLLPLLILGAALAMASCKAKPHISVPTPDCGTPTLAIGSGKFRIETLQPEADGSIKPPPDTSGVAYWVAGTTTNQIFLIGASPDNLNMEAVLLPSFDAATATVTRQNCNSSTYVLAAAQTSSWASAARVDQSSPGITILFEQAQPDSALVVRGALSGETITTINTPSSGTSQIQAEISLLDTTTSADGKTIRIGVSILNSGESSIKLSGENVILISEDGTQSAPAGSEPSLPQTIKRGATQTIYFIFTRPQSQTATLKVFDVEYDIGGY